MNTIVKLTFRSATRDPFLILWSLLVPVAGAIGLGLFVKAPQYPLRILTGMVAASVLFYTLTTTSFAVLRQRRRGVYRLFKVTPMSLWAYVCSSATAWVLIALCSAGLVLVCGMLALGVGLAPLAVIAMVPILLFAALGGVFFSFVIASVGRTENSVSIINNFITLPLLFASDAFYSLQSAPQFVQTISQLNPLQWFVSALRAAAAQSWGSYAANVGLVALTAVVALLLAVKTFRYDEG